MSRKRERDIVPWNGAMDGAARGARDGSSRACFSKRPRAVASDPVAAVAATALMQITAATERRWDAAGIMLPGRDDSVQPEG